MAAKSIIVFAVSAVMITAAHAQQRPGAADPATPVPALRYDSAFTAYQRYEDQPLRSWPEVNREVGAVGGQAGIFGGGGHGTRTLPKAPAQAPLGQGQPPVRAAPKAPGQQVQH